MSQSTDNVTPIAPFSQADRDTALLRLLAEAALELREVPVEDLAALSYGESTAYMTLYGVLKTLEEKLYQMAIWIQAKRFEQELFADRRDEL